MAPWTTDELKKIESAEELEIASLRADGTLRKPTTIWVVRIGEQIYIRAYKGRTSPWFRWTQVRHEGRIRAGGVEKDVHFIEETDSTIIDQVDAAYRDKYRDQPFEYVRPMLTPEAHAATIRLAPR